MSQFYCRVADYVVIVDGQSLTTWPSLTDPDNFPNQLMVGRTTAVLGNVGVGGLAWTQLDNNLETRVGPYLGLSPVVFYLMVGGTTQVSLGQSATAIYNSEGSIIDDVQDLAVSIGVDTFRVIGSTTTPSTSFGADTTVASGSNGVNTNTFTGSGTLNVVSTTNAPTSGTLKVATDGTQATITYTGRTSTTFTGCNTTSGGGVMSTGGAVRNNSAQILYDLNTTKLSDPNTHYDVIVDLAGDSRLDDPSNGTYYEDGTHPTTAGNAAIAELMGAAIDLFL